MCVEYIGLIVAGSVVLYALLVYLFICLSTRTSLVCLFGTHAKRMFAFVLNYIVSVTAIPRRMSELSECNLSLAGESTRHCNEMNNPLKRAFYESRENLTLAHGGTEHDLPRFT